jgi:shikimate kinase
MTTQSLTAETTMLRQPPMACVTLIGMAGAGKSTLGRLLADHLGWAHLDTDQLIEASYGLPLQEVLDGLGLETFLRAEESLVSTLNVRRTVISTGGSVVYGPEAMERLKLLGPIIFLEIDLPAFLKRVGDGEGRGLAIAVGKTREDVFAERQPLYRAAADFTLRTDEDSRQVCLERLHSWLKNEVEL